MPDNNSAGEKTEQPTPRRLEKAREEGQVAKSQELNSAFTLLASSVVLYFLFGNIIQTILNKMATYLSMNEIPLLTIDNAYTILTDAFVFIIDLVSPILIASAVIGILINFVQVGPMLNFKLIQPKVSKLNPIEGAKRLFSLKSVVELVKSLAKAAVIIGLTYIQIRNAVPNMITLTEQGLYPGLLYIANLLFRIIVSVLIFYIILGVADYIYQRWEYMRNMKMTKQEVKDEYKEIEGNPEIKSKRRERQRQMSMNRMISAVEEADVVITNPTHIAVALQFELETMEAPVVVAKGEGFIAQKIKDVAREFEIEIVENKPLARALNAATEIGEEIPPDLYQAVAEVIAFIYRNNNREL